VNALAADVQVLKYALSRNRRNHNDQP
jgi:hypothetical protein